MEFLRHGFLNTRGDFLSDLLICALAVIVPLLLFAVQAGRIRKINIHHPIMLIIYYIVVAYVIVYEANMLLRGGIRFLEENIRMDHNTYWTVTGIHVLLGAVTLIVGGFTIRFANLALNSVDAGIRKRHRKFGWLTFYLLFVTSLTGILVYYCTFVYG